MKTAGYKDEALPLHDGGEAETVGGANICDTNEKIVDYADPIIKRILLQRLSLYINSRGKALNQPEAEDLYQTVILKLLSSLSQENKALFSQNITELANYIATVTHNVCNDYLRMKYPQRNRLKNKLRDLMRRHPDFSYWAVDNRIVCGLSEWNNRMDAGKTASYPREACRRIDIDGVGETIRSKLEGLPLSKLVAELLKLQEGPIEIDELVHLIANIKGIKDQQNENLPDSESSSSEIVELPGKYYGYVEEKELLLRVWEIICELPLNHRKAFFYTTRDYTGESILHRIIREQVVVMARVYEALNTTRDELIAIWDSLPMNAPRAATLIGTSAQMVAKWRHRALKRLSEGFGYKK